ncbi:YmaF family protein [Clostridium sp. CF012]|uniref:YmaF family protein n=1 Tax=Clostridium sp. CF012 TaxID=2843319 RepID=UPI001C0B2453|nr:YmaF family protein [Clostridium sp. CF012]MBU3143119.1 YmaF family protein [Clostridium sp. CF012]
MSKCENKHNNNNNNNASCEDSHDSINLWCDLWCDTWFDGCCKSETLNDEFLGSAKLAELEAYPSSHIFVEESEPVTRITCDHINKAKPRTDFSDYIHELESALAPQIAVIKFNHKNFEEDNTIVDVVISMN